MDNVTEIPTEPPVAGTDVETMIGSLEGQRRTFAWKCADLDAAGLRATVGASSMTLAGLLKHLSLVEDHKFTCMLLGQSTAEPFASVDFDADPDWEWRTALDDEPEQLYGLWRDTVARSRAHLAEALSAGGLDQPIGMEWPDGRTPSVRRLLADLIEEYARHTGHADLLRESIDGRVGEDAPEDWRA